MSSETTTIHIPKKLPTAGEGPGCDWQTGEGAELTAPGSGNSLPVAQELYQVPAMNTQASSGEGEKGTI